MYVVFHWELKKLKHWLCLNREEFTSLDEVDGVSPRAAVEVLTWSQCKDKHQNKYIFHIIAAIYYQTHLYPFFYFIFIGINGDVIICMLSSFVRRVKAINNHLSVELLCQQSHTFFCNSSNIYHSLVDYLWWLIEYFSLELKFIVQVITNKNYLHINIPIHLHQLSNLSLINLQ